MSALFCALSGPIGSSERERSNLPHVIIRPPPTERCSQSLNETVGWTLYALRLIDCTSCAPGQLLPQSIEEPNGVLKARPTDIQSRGL